MIYRIRVILDNDTEDAIFRDVEIRETSTLEDFHNVITQAFGFDGTEMASFYLSDDNWSQGEEISLFDMSEGNESIRLMNETTIDDVLNEVMPKLIYVYDFLNLWTFFVELAEIVEEEKGVDYPSLLYAHGQIPIDAPEKHFEGEALSESAFDDDLNLDDYEDMDFDENWN